MITEPRLPDAACRHWYAMVVRRRHLAAYWSNPAVRIADDLAFWRRYARHNHDVLVQARRHLRVIR